MDASQATRVNDCYVDHLHIHKFSKEGYLYYFKSDLNAGIFDGLHFVELDDSIGSLTWNIVTIKRTSWFIPGIAADGTKDNSWPVYHQSASRIAGFS